MEIASGSNIEVTGGFYSGNASGTAPPVGSAESPSRDQRLEFALLEPRASAHPYIEIDANEPSPVQDVGIYIAGSGASGVSSTIAT